MNSKNICKMKQIKVLQTVFAFLIILHHISVTPLCVEKYGDKYDIILIIRNIGPLLVGFFMFLIGYEIMYKLKHNENIRFFRDSIAPILISFFFCNYAYMIVTQLMGTHYTGKQLIAAFFGILLLNPQMWFAVEVLIMSALTYFIFRKVKSTGRAFALLWVITFVIIVFSLSLGHGESPHGITNWFYGEWWYNSIIFYILGALFAVKQDRIETFFNRKSVIITVVSFVLLLISFAYDMYVMYWRGYWTETEIDMMYKDKIEALVVQTFVVCFFIIFSISVCYLFRFGGKISERLSKIYLELILVNNIFIYIIQNNNLKLNDTIFVTFEILVTYVVAYSIYTIKTLVMGRK